MVDQEEQSLKEARRLEKRAAEEAERLAKEHERKKGKSSDQRSVLLRK
jgi:hypothetical protein